MTASSLIWFLVFVALIVGLFLLVADKLPYGPAGGSLEMINISLEGEPEK